MDKLTPTPYIFDGSISRISFTTFSVHETNFPAIVDEQPAEDVLTDEQVPGGFFAMVPESLMTGLS